MKRVRNFPDGTCDYAKYRWVQQEHHARYKAYVKTHGMTCQECGGAGSIDCGYWEPPDYCGWCESTGLVTRWLRGQWLRFKRSERRAA